VSVAPVDLLLYVSLGAGFLAGRVLPHRPEWTGPATLLSIFVLVALLGASLGPVSPGQLAATLPLAGLFVGAILGFTLLFALALRRPARPAERRQRGTPLGWWLSPALLIALLAGYAVGRATGWSYDPGIDYALYVMLALIAFDVRWSPRGLRRLWLPLTAAAAGVLAAASLFTLVGLLPARIAFATGLGFGWYTLTGALVAANAGAAFGFLAFLTNFFRENLTMVASPWIGPTVGGEGMTAVGGATSMDTTLYFITHFADPEAGSLALASGLVLTVAASVAVPLVLGGL
jgi:uncharacterized membrane protein YbjE (DUF340 family)